LRLSQNGDVLPDPDAGSDSRARLSYSAEVPKIFVLGLRHLGLLFPLRPTVVRILRRVSGKPPLLPLDKLGEVCCLLSPPDEGVLQKILGRRTLARVAPKTERDELLELLAEVALQRRRRVLGNKEEDLHRMDVG
jgi:hypothetical protein